MSGTAATTICSASVSPRPGVKKKRVPAPKSLPKELGNHSILVSIESEAPVLSVQLTLRVSPALAPLKRKER